MHVAGIGLGEIRSPVSTTWASQDADSGPAKWDLRAIYRKISDLPTNWEVEENFDSPPKSKAVKDALKRNDRKGKRAATHERELYRPIANLLNALRNGTGLVDDGLNEKMFYVQDPRLVLGSLLERKPDLDGIYAQLRELAENKNLSTYLSKKKIVGVFLGLLIFFVEV
ncbi:hypothetical protein GGU11DRAFT_836768 [Lentinula aff. detonsa]|uniref:Uncharacterized protein n=1 Tax=Lentinula aff. detonsa TaxID=2804958 RepID=A0AA38NST6_9AGAR|nr:hypothetical protein GGU10DRAFT_329114 [Lentinula aff. detonsa]KAJ3795700.1 hypothetical protein GGU11DRAFT_836768 [Lentinula aff. detonsa]